MLAGGDVPGNTDHMRHSMQIDNLRGHRSIECRSVFVPEFRLEILNGFFFMDHGGHPTAFIVIFPKVDF